MPSTDLAFHFNAPSKHSYACKLLRKATAAGARVVVLAEPALLARLDMELWTFSPLDFIAHVRLPCSAHALASSPVLLCDSLDEHGDALAAVAADALTVTPAAHSVLVNLTTTVPSRFTSFSRVIEVVSHDEADRQAARARWKHYTGLGYTITRHDLKLSA
jgi:DNA polymerase III subunit chi